MESGSEKDFIGKLLQAKGKYTLAEVKHAFDSLLDGKEINVVVATEDAASALVRQAKESGARCEVVAPVQV